MYDTIIIGAGMSGLAAGIRLAHYDRRVCILERHTTIGGLNSFYRMRGRDYDVGLHAVTNFTPKGTRRGPLARILRQLRFRRDDFALRPQLGSQIAFPDVTLNFGNDFELFESEIAKHFPGEKDNLRRLVEKIVDYDNLEPDTYDLSSRAILEETIGDPMLREMILCPLMWYGCAKEDDMDFGQFSILFRSILMEGFARPLAGVRLILRNLIRKFRGLGGELRLRSGVREIRVENGRACGVVLDSGEEIEARRVLSSAGWLETMRMCDENAGADLVRENRLSFVESISILDQQPADLGHDTTIVFYNDSNEFRWRQPDDFCDVRTGVICSPNNYAYTDDEGGLPDGVMRVTALADFGRWTSLDDEAYQLEKLRWYDRVVESAMRFVPDYRSHVIDTDFFTPKTITRFTGHTGGAVYGGVKKSLDGSTDVENLYLCGNDQGFVGIVGAMFSGIAMANRCLHAGGEAVS